MGVIEFILNHKKTQSSLSLDDRTIQKENSAERQILQIDEYFPDAGRYFIKKNKASIGLLQKMFKIGFNRAAQIMDQLAEAGVVSQESSTRARQVLMSRSEFEQLLNSGFVKIKTPNAIEVSSIYKEAEDNLSDVDTMTGTAFEHYCASVLSDNGFIEVHVTKASGDYGADILAMKDQIRYVIQCKRSESSIGVQAIQEVLGSRSIYKCHVGVVLTNNYFTENAKKLAEANNILLWNRDVLNKMASEKHQVYSREY